jgi:IAA-amino acid hydrolase
MLGIDKVKDMQPLMGSEDFAFYQEMIPGYIFFLGMQNETHKQLHPPLSHPT